MNASFKPLPRPHLRSIQYRCSDYHSYVFENPLAQCIDSSDSYFDNSSMSKTTGFTEYDRRPFIEALYIHPQVTDIKDIRHVGVFKHTRFDSEGSFMNSVMPHLIFATVVFATFLIGFGGPLGCLVTVQSGRPTKYSIIIPRLFEYKWKHWTSRFDSEGSFMNSVMRDASLFQPRFSPRLRHASRWALLSFCVFTPRHALLFPLSDHVTPEFFSSLPPSPTPLSGVTQYMNEPYRL